MMHYLAILFPIHTHKKKNLNALKRKVMYLLANQNDIAQGAGVGVGEIKLCGMAEATTWKNLK